MKRKHIVFFVVLTVLAFVVITWQGVRSNKEKKKNIEKRAFSLRFIYNGDMLSMFDTYDITFPACPSPSYHNSKDDPSSVVSWRFYCSLWLNGGRDARKYFRHDEPWNSEINFKVCNPNYCWMGYPKSPSDTKKYWTNVMALTGPDTGFELQTSDKLYDCDDLIILVEVKDSGIHWGQPGDIDIRNLPPKLTSGIDGNGFLVLFLDGTIWFVKREVPMEILKRFFTATGARTYDREDELIKYACVIYRPNT